MAISSGTSRVSRACICAATLFLSACGSLNHEAARAFPQIPSYAIAQSEKTSIGTALAPDVAVHAGQSGFRVLETGTAAYRVRLGLIEAAEKTLDLQYYSINDDITANLLIEAVVRAAARGVRVRLLVDDIAVDDVAQGFAILDSLKGLEIRVYNPFATRDDGIGGRVLNALTDADQMNRRMHNKALIADNQMAVIGGRNLGDEYFEANTDVTFRDIDILAAGPVTADISRSFDAYWNDKNAVPIGQIHLPSADPARVAALRASLKDQWDRVSQTPDGKKLLGGHLAERLQDADIKLTWAPCELAADNPAKTENNGDAPDSRPLSRLQRMASGAKQEFIVVSPYLVPGDEGVAWMKGMVDRGVNVRALTNSLASTDVVAAHTGYKTYRWPMLQSGVELYELKPIDGAKPRQRLAGASAPAHASLHAKVYVVDRRDTMIGSFNLDPRSAALNTELALVIHSPEVAARMAHMFEEASSPQTSYRLLPSPDGRVVWRSIENGALRDRGDEPGAGFWRGLESNMISLLPIEDDL